MIFILKPVVVFNSGLLCFYTEYFVSFVSEKLNRLRCKNFFINPLLFAYFFSRFACSEDSSLPESPNRTNQVQRAQPVQPDPTGPTGPVYDPTADWMTILLTEHDDRAISLKNICLPRAHDAGMYALTTCTIGANACNTQTQDLNMTKMLQKGVRNFDIRPVLAGGIYFTQHKTGCEDALGCRGDRIVNILQQTKDFVEEHSELVILDFSHFCDIESLDAGLQELVNTTLGDRLYKESTSFSNNLAERDLNTIIPPSEGKGKVIIVYEGVSNTPENRANGVFSYSYLPVSGSYANSFDVDVMIADQQSKYSSFDHASNRLFEISWTLTLNEELSIACAFTIFDPPGIEHYANIARGRLEGTITDMMTDGSIAKNKIPNLIGIDFADEFVTEQCLRISEMNLE
jgi:hypothetical protein